MITKVYAGEYATMYQHDNGTVWANVWDNGKPVYKQMPGINYVDGHGGQYHCALLDKDGNSWNAFNQQTIIGRVVPTMLPKAEKAYAFYEATLVISNGVIWIADEKNIMGVGSNIAFTNPIGVKFTSIAVSANTTGRGLYGLQTIIALGDDKNVYLYKAGSLTPTKVAGLSGVNTVTACGIGAYVVVTDTDIFAWTPQVWGRSEYAGFPTTNITKPTSVKQYWAAAGAVWPYKQVIGNYNTLHIIDATDTMFGAGMNAMGEVGNGSNIKYTSNAWGWENGIAITAPTKLAGKWKNICTSNTITFYLYAQDLAGNWFAWGRNKSFSLGNGITLREYDINGVKNSYASFPNALDVPTPMFVDPITATWKVVDYKGEALLPITPLRTVPTGIAYTQADMDALNAQIATLITTNQAQTAQIFQLTNGLKIATDKINVALKALA